MNTSDPQIVGIVGMLILLALIAGKPCGSSLWNIQSVITHGVIVRTEVFTAIIALRVDITVKIDNMYAYGCHNGIHIHL